MWHMDVIYTGSGDRFEGAGRVYGNYKVVLNVSLLNGSTDQANTLTESRASSFIIYTNARVVPNFLDD